MSFHNMLSQSLFRIKEFRTHLTMRRYSFLDRFFFTNLFLYMFNIRLSFTKDILALFTSKFPPFFTFTGGPVFLPKAGRGGPFENLITFGTLDILKKQLLLWWVMTRHGFAERRRAAPSPIQNKNKLTCFSGFPWACRKWLSNLASEKVFRQIGQVSGRGLELLDFLILTSSGLKSHKFTSMTSGSSSLSMSSQMTISDGLTSSSSSSMSTRKEQVNKVSRIL